MVYFCGLETNLIILKMEFSVLKLLASHTSTDKHIYGMEQVQLLADLCSRNICSVIGMNKLLMIWSLLILH